MTPALAPGSLVRWQGGCGFWFSFGDQPLNRVLSELLDQTLPSLADLTDQLKGQGSDDS